MYILDTNYYKSCARIHLFISLLLFIFSLIYEYFSHEVYSSYMLFSPLIPLILGTVINYILYFSNKIKINNINANIHNSLILCLTLGSLFKGALDIYGTTNRLICIYPLIAILLFLTNIVIIVRLNITK